jgi:hypothetical protein
MYFEKQNHSNFIAMKEKNIRMAQQGWIFGNV